MIQECEMRSRKSSKKRGREDSNKRETHMQESRMNASRPPTPKKSGEKSNEVENTDNVSRIATIKFPILEESNERETTAKIARRPQTLSLPTTQISREPATFLVAIPMESQAILIPQQIIRINPATFGPRHSFHSPPDTPIEPPYQLPRMGIKKLPLNPGIIHGLGRVKISNLKQQGFRTVEDLATVNAYDVSIAQAVTNNRSRRQATATLVMWRDRARTYLANLENNTEIEKQQEEESFLI